MHASSSEFLGPFHRHIFWNLLLSQVNSHQSFIFRLWLLNGLPFPPPLICLWMGE